jgi:nicotinate-nucleotide adenylyltransferase
MDPDRPVGVRLGILGGTFDPFHVGHLIVAQDVLEALALDRIFLIPAGIPPHKSPEGVTPAPLRARMVRAAVADDPRFQVSDLELKREGPSFTVDTLEALREEDPTCELHLLMGADQWEGFSGWRRPRRIVELARLVLMTRHGERPGEVDPVFEDGPPPSFVEVPVTRIDISSSQLRDRLREGHSVRYLVPEGVRRIIEAGNLYS